MLASINPLGERGRQQRWGTTVGWYFAGSLVGGTLAGGAAGSLGAALDLSIGAAATVAAALTLAAAAHELGLLAAPLPGPRRQVDEDWLHRYRGWVYGLGFGFQLGLGVTTIVTTAAVPLTIALALLTGSPAWGGAVGATFGLARAVPLLTTARLDSADALRAFHRTLADRQPLARQASAAALGAIAVALLVAGAGA